MLVICVVILIFCSSTIAKTAKENEKLLQVGLAKVFLGIVTSNYDVFRQGVLENRGANTLRSTLDPYLGEKVLKLGKAFYDFPLCPPIHLSVNYASKENLDIAGYLLRKKVDINAFRLPSPNGSYYERGYPPGIMYGLGLGQKVSHHHAPFIQRIHRTFPDAINITKVNIWRKATGNSPLLHMTIMMNNFDGTYLLLSEFSQAVNVRDMHNMTALHIAAWKGDVETTIMLLHNGGDVFEKDIYGHTAVHIALFRHEHEVMALLLGNVLNNYPNKSSRLKELLLKVNTFHFNIIEYLLLPPIDIRAIEVLKWFLDEYNIRMEDLFPKKDIHVIEKILQLLKRSSRSDIMKDKLIVSLLGVDRVNSRGMNKNSFAKHYFVTQRPVVLSADLTIGLGVWAYMDSYENLLSRFAGLSWEILEETEILQGSSIYKKVLLSEIVERLPKNGVAEFHIDTDGSCRTGDGRECVSVTDNNTSDTQTGFIAFAEISRRQYENDLWQIEISRPEIFNLCGSRDQERFQLQFISTGVSPLLRTPVTQQNASWHLLLKGVEVKYHLLTPGTMNNRTLWQEVREIFNISAEIEIPTLVFVEEIAPVLRQRGLLISVQLRLGEVLFIPHDWAYFTSHTQPTLTLVQQFCTFWNTDTRVQPLGYVLYGGEDVYRGYGWPKTHHLSNTNPGWKYSVNHKPPVFEYPFAS